MENGQSVNGTAVLQQKLNDPNTVAALTRLLDRIDSLEQTVNTLATTIEQAPNMVSMVTDMADETYKQAAAEGVDIEARLKAGLAMAEKLTSPEMMERLDKLILMTDQAPYMVSMVTDMADETYREAAARGIDIETRLKAGLAMAEKLTSPEMMERLDKLLLMTDQAPYMVSMVTDIADETYREAATRGIDIEARLKAGLAMAEKLTSPEMMTKLDQLLMLSEHAPGMVSMMTDIVDDGYRQLAADGIDVEERLRVGLAIMAKATDPQTMTRLDHMFDTLLAAEEGVLNQEAVEMVGMAAHALVVSQQRPLPKVGLFGLLRALRDPDIERAVGFLLNFGKEFGQRMNDSN